MTNLLVVDDEKRVRDSIRLTLDGEGFDITEAEDLESAYRLIAKDQPDIVLLDVHFRGGETCLSLLERLKSEDTKIPIILLSGAASAKEAADAIRLGAYDFLEKPIGAERLRITIQNALDASNLKSRTISATVERNVRTDLIGESAALQKVKELIGQFGRRDAKVLITGETGTGKELVAHGIWRASPRCGQPFIVVNSAAIPEALIESELFGHRKGSFTGATGNQMGKIEMANRGSLFLDEIGELSLSAQSKLLRFLESGEIQVIGENRAKKCDVRLIAATSRDLIQEIKAGRFREDLYFRLNVARIEIPPLRERREDILPIFQHFVATICKKYEEPIRFVDEDARSMLFHFNWPGNVRELRNVAERVVLLSKNTVSRDLVQDIIGPNSLRADQSADLPRNISEAVPLKEYRRAIEIKYIEHVLKLAEGSVTKAAHALELDRSHLHQKLKDLGIT